jgi:hypothetical protein
MLKLCHKLNSKGDTSLGDLPPSSHNDIFRGYDAMTATNLSKICTKCKIEKAVSEFSKNKSLKSGLQSQCKVCNSESNHEYRRTNQKKESERNRKYREANKDEIKERTRKHREYNLKKVRERERKYYANNTDKVKKARQEYYKINKEKIWKRQRKYDIKNREKVRIRQRKYQKENAVAIRKNQQKYNKNNKEKITKLKKQWIINNPEKFKISSRKGAQKHRALKRKATIEDFSHIEVFERDRYICQLCGCKTSLRYKNQYHPKRSELDHITPLSKGGAHSRRNTQCLCHQCNIEKNNNTKFGDQLRMFG